MFFCTDYADSAALYGLAVLFLSCTFLFYTSILQQYVGRTPLGKEANLRLAHSFTEQNENSTAREMKYLTEMTAERLKTGLAYIPLAHNGNVFVPGLQIPLCIHLWFRLR